MLNINLHVFACVSVDATSLSSHKCRRFFFVCAGKLLPFRCLSQGWACMTISNWLQGSRQTNRPKFRTAFKGKIWDVLPSFGCRFTAAYRQGLQAASLLVFKVGLRVQIRPNADWRRSQKNDRGPFFLLRLCHFASFLLSPRWLQPRFSHRWRLTFAWHSKQDVLFLIPSLFFKPSRNRHGSALLHRRLNWEKLQQPLTPFCFLFFLSSNPPRLYSNRSSKI